MIVTTTLKTYHENCNLCQHAYTNSLTILKYLRQNDDGGGGSKEKLIKTIHTPTSTV